MTWANFYLVCFLVGFLLSACSLLFGTLQLHVHVPHAGDGFHLHVGDAGHAGGPGLDAGGDVGGGEVAVSPFNFGTIAAFLAWFGGSGYLFTRWSPAWSIAGLFGATLVGVAGAALVFAFLLRLSSPEENLDPADYRMAGVIGRVSSGIRAGGTGEIVYSQEGTRRTSGARSDDGGAIPRGTEVVITRYEKGIAYVERWDQLAREEGLQQEEPTNG